MTELIPFLFHIYIVEKKKKKYIYIYIKDCKVGKRITRG